jgi:hypothetical protein
VKITPLPLDNQVSAGVAAKADQLREQMAKIAVTPVKTSASTDQIGDGRGRLVNTKA